MQWQRPAENHAVASRGGVPTWLNIGVIVASVLIPLVAIGAILVGIEFAIGDNPARKSVGKVWIGAGIVGLILLAVFLEAGSEPAFF